MASTSATSWRANSSASHLYGKSPSPQTQLRELKAAIITETASNGRPNHQSIQPDLSGASEKQQAPSPKYIPPHREISHSMDPAVRGHPPVALRPHGQILKQREAWHLWTELTVKVTNLPSNITTWELWQTFEREGTVAFIELFENRQGHKEGTAKVRFSPPPRHAFWTEGFVIVQRTESEGFFKARVELEPRKRPFRIQSPIWKNIFYPETMHLYPSSVSFGVMHDEFTMMNMYSAQALPQTSSATISRAATSFRVDLLRGRIVIYFQVKLTEPRSAPLSGAVKQVQTGPLDRVNTYMFTIPLAQLRKIYRIENGEKQWSLIISLESPPVFFRKRLDPKASHAKRSLVWSEFDTWFRQTDIVYDPRRLETAEVTLRKDLAVIDIGRWTTYRIMFDKSRDEPGVYDIIQNALQDYNIEIVHLDRLEIIPGPSAAEIEAKWVLIDPPKLGKMGNEASQSESIAIADLHLPFEVRYQLEVCISHGILNEHNINLEFVNALADLTRRDQAKARNVLEYVMEQEKRIFDPILVLNDKEALAYSSKSKIPSYCAYSRKAIITPTTIYYNSPAVETTNRVIRKYTQLYGDRFLRVQFTDEKTEGAINSCTDKARNDEIYTRVWRTLRNGIRLGDRHYHFLAFGNSQFRQNGAYFFCPTDDLSCYNIRHWMGDFTDIKVVAKYAARLGQCFSTTRAIHRCRPNIVRIEDFWRNGYCFTDGVGKISEIFASMIAAELNLPQANAAPSAFQFRLGGCKGVLAKWPDVKGLDVHIRKSQFKFKALYNGLEIIRWSQYSLAALNRQTIQILSSLGVRDAVFNRMLLEQLSNYQAAMTDKRKALDLLSRYVDENQMTIIIAGMVLNGFMETGEPFLMSILHLWRAWSIKLLKEKARIIVENGAFLLGVTDETGTLLGHKKIANGLYQVPNVNDLPQIFVQIPDKDKKGGYVVIEGLCLVGRNPSLHPGDIRVVQAVNNPSLYHLKDVVVFSQQGDRDVPSMCSGGDLDGDDFFVIWDKDLIPMEWNPEPMDYTASKAIELDRPVEIQDVMKFFVRYMKNDTLGSIAHAHLAQSDFLDGGIKDPRCLELTELHSKAVDYIKTGEPAELPKYLRPRRWPHFMEKRHKPKEQIYCSEKILGQLYDKVESVNFVPHYTQPFDRRIRDACTPTIETLETSRQLKAKYDTAIRRIMAQQEIETEFEVWSTFSLSKPRVGTDYKMQEELANIAGALKDRFRRICIEAAGGTDPEHLEPFVAAMYQVTREEMEIALIECGEMKNVGGREVPVRKMEPKYMPLISFPWLFYEVLGKLASGVALREDVENLGMSFLSTAAQPETLRKTKLVDVSDFDAGVETAQGIIHLGEEFDLERLPEHHARTASSMDNLLLIDISESPSGWAKGASKFTTPLPPSGLEELMTNANEIENKISQTQKAPTSVSPMLSGYQQSTIIGRGGACNIEEVDIEEVMSHGAEDSRLESLTGLIERHHKDDQLLEEELLMSLEQESPLEKLAKLTRKNGADESEVEIEETIVVTVEEDSPLTKLIKLTEVAELENEDSETNKINYD